MTCGECRFYVTDEEEGKLIEHFKHCSDSSAFCVVQPLFTTVYACDLACNDFIPEYTTDKKSALLNINERCKAVLNK